MWGSRDPLLEFLDPPNIMKTVEARNFKFGTETDDGECGGQVTHFWNIETP